MKQFMRDVAAEITPMRIPFQHQTTITIPGVRHGFTTTHLIIQLYGEGDNPPLFLPDLITLHPMTYDIIIQFLPHRYTMDPLAPVSTDSYWQGLVKSLRRTAVLRRLWPAPRYWCQEPPQPRSGVVVIFPLTH